MLDLTENLISCPAEPILKLITGKWKPQILRLATYNRVRFNSLLKEIPGSNKQSLSVALKELEEAAILSRIVISDKPLHVEYELTEKGKATLSIFAAAAHVAKVPAAPTA